VPVEEAPAMAHEAAMPPDQPALEAAHDEGEDNAADKMKGALARSAAKVGPALTSGFGKVWNRARVTMALLAAKRRGGSSDDIGVPLRRVTSPPPGGGLHTAGRKVVRGELQSDEPEAEAPAGFVSRHKRKIALVGTVGVAVVLAGIALKKPAAPAPLASAPPTENAAAAGGAGIIGAPNITMPAATINASPNGLQSMDPAVAAPPPGAPAPMTDATDGHDKHGKHGKVAPFGNGSVATHANLLHIKMDGPIDKINGAQTPTGFNVTVPGRRSLEAAGPLAQRDARIASLRVSNETSGAELNMTFKDGVPTYQVRAKGDTLEIALAPISAGADKPEHHSASAHKKKHSKH
jgi:hypothetical protein